MCSLSGALMVVIEMLEVTTFVVVVIVGQESPSLNV
jgi:hypothetical protein